MNTQDMYYFYTTGCAYCAKVEPVVDKLNQEGYNILKLDLEDKENKEVMNELQQKFNFKCGTPLLIDPNSGNLVCGSRDEDLLRKWADGQSIPPLQQPVSSMPPVPLLKAPQKEVKQFIKNYNKWLNENSHLIHLKSADEMLELTPRPISPAPAPPVAQSTPAELAAWKKVYQKWASQNTHLKNLVTADTVVQRLQSATQQPKSSTEVRLSNLEAKLDKLLKHLGVS